MMELESRTITQRIERVRGGPICVQVESVYSFGELEYNYRSFSTFAFAKGDSEEDVEEAYKRACEKADKLASEVNIKEKPKIANIIRELLSPQVERTTKEILEKTDNKNLDKTVEKMKSPADEKRVKDATELCEVLGWPILNFTEWTNEEAFCFIQECKKIVKPLSYVEPELRK